MEVRFTAMPATALAGYVLKTGSRNGENFRAIPPFWDEYMNGGRMKKLHSEPFVENHAEYGVCFPEDSAGNFEYVIGVEISGNGAVPPAYHRCAIPAADCAVFSTPPSDAAGFIEAIQETWRRIFSEWLPQSGYAIDPAGLSFELYGERAMRENGKVCEIYLPVVAA